MKSAIKAVAICIIVSLFLLACFSVAALGATLPSMPKRYVVDQAGVVEHDIEMKLNGYLQELEQKTSAQVVVLTIQSLDGASLEDFSLQVAEKWKLGQKGKDNGLLMLFAINDGKYRFEVGYGLEGMLPDSKVGTIGREYIVPYFRQGDYTSGITAATLAVAQVIAQDSGVQITGMPNIRPSANAYRHGRAEKPGIGGVILSVLLFIGFIYMLVRHPRLLLFMVLFSGMGGGRRGWSGGGGFGGGGFGGFGGGGGGGFGGGGASGGW